jgi:hypothetical protein
MNKIIYGLLGYCVIACGKTEPSEPEDINTFIVKKVFDEDPIAIDFIQKEKNEETIDTLQQCIINNLKNGPFSIIFCSNEEKISLAKMLVHFITKNYDSQTSTLTQEMILQQLNDFADIVSNRYSNVFTKIPNFTLDKKKKIVLAYSINDCHIMMDDENDLMLIEKLKKLTITNTTSDVEIFNKVRAALSPKI